MTSTSSRTSKKFDLDDSDKSEILVYKYRGGLEVQSQQDLARELDKNPALRCSRKPIPRGNSRIEVRAEDLYNEPERTAYQQYPNIKNSLASIGLPSVVYWKRLLLNQFKDLYIVSPESSPDASPEASQHTSPTNTFHHDHMRSKDSADSEPPSAR